jgi:subtilisin family serine protease
MFKVAIALLGLIASSTAQKSSADKVPGCYMVSFKSSSKGVSKSSSMYAQALNAQANARVAASSIGKITSQYDRALNGFTVCGVKSESQLESLRRNPEVALIEQDQVVKASALKDVINPLSWGLDRIDQRSNSLDSRYTYNDTAAPVNVYVLDTGIFTNHTQFEGRAISGYNFVDNTNDASDCNGHGTHCAGTVGGKDYGVCKFCKLIAVKVLGCSGSGTWSGVVAGINWAMKHANSTGIPSVISMSLGGGYSAIVNDAVSAAVRAGIVTVVAAGNDNRDACYYSPASTPSAITVGSTTSTGARSYFSNYGSCVDIFAPGSSITSAWIGSNSATNTISGTSMATPHVAGVAAVYRAYNPLRNASEVRDHLVDRISTLNAVSGLDASTPNRLLFSRIDRLNHSDRVLPTLPPTLSPTLPPTQSPTPLVAFPVNLTIMAEIRNYYGNEFPASASQYLFGEFFPLTSSFNLDLDLILEQKVSSGWLKVASAETSSNFEKVSFTTVSGGSYRWRLYVYSASTSLGRWPFTFRSNILNSLNFSSSTPSPTGSPTQAPTLPPTQTPAPLVTFPVNLTLTSEIRNYYGNEFPASASQNLFGEFFPLSSFSFLDFDLDLILEQKGSSGWFSAKSSARDSNFEQVSYTTVLAGFYRWRLFVYRVNIPNGRWPFTFRSNVLNSLNFSVPTSSPTLSPTTRSPTLSPSASPTVGFPSVFPSIAPSVSPSPSTSVPFFYVNLPIDFTRAHYIGNASVGSIYSCLITSGLKQLD